mgnify:CR=1 FL=1
MRLGLACLTACLLSSPALAQDGMRQLGAHVHGAAQLAVAADSDGAVLAELTTPAYNLYVFEHAPETAADRAVVSEAARTLSGASMIALSGAANCTLTGTQVGGGPDVAADHDHEHEHEHEHEHGDHHDADHDDQDHHHNEDHHHEATHDHGEDEHTHAHDEDAGLGHADVVVSWTFECARPARLSEVDLSGLFAAFPQFETLEVQYFDGARAAARDLTPARPVLTLD